MSLVVGVVVTVVASVVPARRASKVAPIEALRESEDAGESGLGRRFVVGLIVTVIGVASLLYGLFALPSNAASLIGLGAAVTFIGVGDALPAGGATHGVRHRVAGGRAWAVQGQLGRQNAMRNPRRTASTASALMIGLGLVAMVAILSASLKASFTAALEKNLRADLIVTHDGPARRSARTSPG